MVNSETLKLIQDFEGLRLEAYPDPGSVDGNPWTIGYGHTGPDVVQGMKITKEKATAFLKEDLKESEDIIEELVTAELNENQYGALVSFVFNIGKKLFKKSSVLRYINEGRLAEVPGRMALYRMNDGKVMNGLVRRRSAEGTLWMKPVPTMVASPNEQIKEEVKEAQGIPAQPAPTKKPWDWGVFGVIVTTLAGLSDEFKKLLGDVTSALGVPPLYILAALVLGFGAWTVYSKWKER